jgi:DsbC/DsbD-like thiol-disulfide interchange protein
MKKVIICFVLAFGLFVATDTNAQTVSGNIGTIKKGVATKGTVTLSIPGGLHTNSNRPGSSYAIPTTLSLTSANAKVGGVAYPRGKNKKFSFSEETLNIYEGTVTMSFTVSVPANFKGDSIKVRAVVKFQACNDEVCFPPKTKEVTLTASVK